MPSESNNIVVNDPLRLKFVTRIIWQTSMPHLWPYEIYLACNTIRLGKWTSRTRWTVKYEERKNSEEEPERIALWFTCSGTWHVICEKRQNAQKCLRKLYKKSSRLRESRKVSKMPKLSWIDAQCLIMDIVGRQLQGQGGGGLHIFGVTIIFLLSMLYVASLSERQHAYMLVFVYWKIGRHAHVSSFNCVRSDV